MKTIIFTNYYIHRASKAFSKGVQTLIDWSVPSLGTISMIVQLPEVGQQVGLFLDVNTLSTFVSSESVSFRCSGCFTIHNSSCLCQQYYPALSFSSMVACMLTTSKSMSLS